MAHNTDAVINEVVEEVINANYADGVPGNYDPLDDAYLARALDADAVRNLMYAAAQEAIKRITEAQE